MIGGLMIHGLKPGPALFTQNAGTVYGFILSMFISNIVFIPMGLLIARYGIKFIKTPPSILGPLVIGLAVMGSYAINMSLVDVWIMLFIGLMGFVMKKFDVPREPLVLGLVLGTMAEGELARSMALAQGSVPALMGSMFTRPISLIIIFLTVLSVFQGLRSQKNKKKRAGAAI